MNKGNYEQYVGKELNELNLSDNVDSDSDSATPRKKNKNGCTPSTIGKNVKSPSVAGPSKRNTNNLEDSGMNT